jgi:hypothetical protein
VRLLPAIAGGFPAAVGCGVADFRWQADVRLVVESACRWSAIIGRLDTPVEVADVPGQIAALASLKGRLNLVQPNFGYVDLEDPSAPAVGGSPGPARPGTAAAAVAAAPASPKPVPTAPPPAPRPTPAPTPPPPTPRPTAYSFSVGAPPRR